MLNNFTGMGRLTKDPELRKTDSGKSVTAFTIAQPRLFDKTQTEYFDIVTWNNTAEFVSNYFKKGMLVVVSGKIQTRDWTDREGNKRKAFEVVANECYFAESKKQENKVENKQLDEDFGLPIVPVEDDGDLPF